MRRSARLVVVLVTTALVVAMLGAAPSGAAPRAASTVPSTGALAAATVAGDLAARRGRGAPDRYSPRTGVKFNEPYGRAGHSPHAIRTHILRSINSVKRGGQVRVASWNIRGRMYVDALIRAHRRGASVRVIIDRGNFNREHPNPEMSDLKERLKRNKRRPASLKSWVRKCSSSCRGTSGLPHSKFFLFDRVGKREFVTMYGSNNATDVAAKDQWNDLFTIAGDAAVHGAFLRVFKEMSRDRRVRGGGFRKVVLPRWTFHFYPYRGKVAKRIPDPDLWKLNQVRCTGATGGAGYQGRTKIRMAQDALLGERGKRIAEKLVRMKRAGCDIRIVYALFGRQVRRILDRGGVPTLQYSYDRNRDGMYDIYLHMKALAISGVYAGRTNARVTFNGTANWSGTALASDEVVGEIHNRRITAQYVNWVDFLYRNRPGGWGPSNLAYVGSSGGTERRAPVDPYAIMKREGL